MKPLVSIITPSLNQGAYIEATIKSVLNQDYPHLKYVVVDGGSSDNTLDILKKYDGQLKWISEPDNGQAAAINKGIEMTKGDIVAWLNSDDVLLPGAVAKVVECFQSGPHISMVYGKSHFIDATGKIVGKYPTEPFDFERLAVFNFICQPSAFFTKEAFHQLGGLDLNLQYALDLDLWIKMGKAFSIEYLPEFMSCYRLHDTSKTVDNVHALANHKETLDVALKHYNWAPINKVYGYCYHVIMSKLPRSMGKFTLLIMVLGILFSFVRYLQLNKGIRRRDIKALSIGNLKKLGVPWDALYQSY